MTVVACHRDLMCKRKGEALIVLEGSEDSVAEELGEAILYSGGATRFDSL